MTDLISVEKHLSKNSKKNSKGQILYFNHRISFDTKGAIALSSKRSSYMKVTVDAFSHYVALNAVPHCSVY